MEKLKYIDPIAYGFMKDKSLEIPERVGEALLCAAKYADISFDKNILPHCELGKNSCGQFAYFDSVWYNFGKFDALLASHPECKDELTKLRAKFEVYTEKKTPMKAPQAAIMGDTGTMWGGSFGGHANPDFGRIINLGTDGIREMIAENRKLGIPDSEAFYRGCITTLDAIDILGGRYGALAHDMAERCTGNEREMYLEAAKAFETVPKKPARNFTEAAHAFWLIFSLDGIDSPGRFDQYMARAWDASEDKDSAYRMLGRIWDAFHDTRAWNLCVSGSDENWNDESNDLTYSILKLAADKKYETPNLTVRVHRNTPEKLWSAILDTIASGIGMPVIYNDEVVCTALEKLGIPSCDSHCYCMNGCNQIDIFGKSHMGLEDGEVVLAKCVELALSNGINTVTGIQQSIKTGDLRLAESYSEVERAFYEQMEYLIYLSCNCANSAQQARATYGANPLRSCLIEGCLEKGRDYRNAGPLYGHGQILAEGIADAGDSMYAVKKLVFDEKKYTMETLIDALDANFCGYEELWHDFRSCPKFGNGIEEVDSITAGIVNRFFTLLKRQRTYRGGIFTGGCSPDDRAVYYASKIGALPSGKKKGEPMLADSIAAVPGCDVNGPTSLISSVIRYNQTEAGSGFIFQIKFDKKIFCTDKGKESFKALVKAYFSAGGQQCTATVVSPDELLDAKENPERHRDLIVRVGGFSGYFVELGKEIQDNVIARTFADIG